LLDKICLATAFFDHILFGINCPNKKSRQTNKLKLISLTD